MPIFSYSNTDSFQAVLRRVQENIYTKIQDLKITAYKSKEPIPYEKRKEGEEVSLKVGDSWGELFDCAWFHFEGKVSKEEKGKHLVLLIDIGGELCIYDESGVPKRGLTNGASKFDTSLGMPVKQVYQLTNYSTGAESIDLWADAGCNGLFGSLDDGIKKAEIAVCHSEIRSLYYDFEVLVDYIETAPKNTARYSQIVSAVKNAYAVLHNFDEEEIKQAREILAPVFAMCNGNASLFISAIGHSHLDLAWLWPIRETIRKAARTLSTTLDLLERYPDYRFGLSQPQILLWMEDHYPKLYEKVKEKIKEGRIEPQGAMWVEADMNVSGGEALIRQVIHGKKYFKEKFGVEITHLWLPDVFGYNGALPQILKRSEVDYFMTQKLSWCSVNTYPHHSFKWQGIDGSQILTHLLPEDTYNGPALPRSAIKMEQNYKNKDISDKALMVFGIGDGGGGPGAEHLERLARMKNFASLPPITQESAHNFFEKWAQDAEKFPVWVGELYLEMHQGTFTTQARNKWYNRKIEFALREFEFAAARNMVFIGKEYPQQQLDTIWKEILLYQFHDILPGSSIERVYTESVERYKAILEELQQEIQKADKAYIKAKFQTNTMEKPHAIFNTLSWTQKKWLKVCGQWIYLETRSMGCSVIDGAKIQNETFLSKATETSLENDKIKVLFHYDGSISSLYDKDKGCEVIEAGKYGNKLAVYQDSGDAWDFAMNYEDKAYRYMKLISSEAEVDGPKAIMKQVYTLGKSKLTQIISIVQGSKRIDFESILDWHEPKTMLRTSFPVNVFADTATCDIQYGTIKRPTHNNTSWDYAKCEIPCQKWADISQRDYGVALINDSKYGYKVKGNILDLNLLRSVPYPNSAFRNLDCGDFGTHYFTYALFPHKGDHVGGQVMKEGYEVNIPLRFLEITPCKNDNKQTDFSFLSLDSDTVVIESIKKAEKSDAIIVRMYESAHMKTEVTLDLSHIPVRTIQEVNLIENDIATLEPDNGKLSLQFSPFEIKTIRLDME